jgi:hypothetical protein
MPPPPSFSTIPSSGRWSASGAVGGPPFGAHLRLRSGASQRTESSCYRIHRLIDLKCRGRDDHRRSPPALNRTGASTHTAPTLDDWREVLLLARRSSPGTLVPALCRAESGLVRCSPWPAPFSPQGSVENHSSFAIILEPIVGIAQAFQLNSRHHHERRMWAGSAATIAIGFRTEGSRATLQVLLDEAGAEVNVELYQR